MKAADKCTLAQSLLPVILNILDMNTLVVLHKITRHYGKQRTLTPFRTVLRTLHLRVYYKI
jgi:hypothetical protein